MRNILLTPGPATTTNTVKEKMVLDKWHRTDDFVGVVKSIRKDLVRMAKGKYKEHTAVLFGSSGTGAMEACMCSIPRDKDSTGVFNSCSVTLSNGMYGDRFGSIANYLNIRNEHKRVHTKCELDIEWLDTFLRSVPDVSAVFMTHHETSTGRLNDIKRVKNVVKKYNVPLVVDCISSFSAVPVSLSDADYIIGTANKCIQGMSGISFVICSKDHLKDIKWNSQSYYFNLGQQHAFFEKTGQFRFTPPVQVIYALRQALDELFKEGINNRYKRYVRNWEMLVNGMHSAGFKSYFDDSVPRSKILETFYYLQHKNFDFIQFKKLLYEKGYTIYDGAIKDTFRVCNIGDINGVDISSFLLVMDVVLKKMGIE